MRTRVALLAPLVLALASPAPAAWQEASRRPLPAAPPRVPLRAFAKTGGRVTGGALTSTVVVKVREGRAASVVDGRLVADGRATDVLRDAGARVEPTFARQADALRADSARASAESGVELADLSLYFDAEASSPDAALALACALEACDDVELAYVRPAPPPLPEVRPAPQATAKTAATTPDFSATQFYLESSPGGFGVAPSRNEPGGLGEGVRIVDIEYSWNLDHEDMPFAAAPEKLFMDERGVDPVPDDQGNHGTAALGMLVAADNGFGVTGIAPGVEVGIVNPVTSDGKYKLETAIVHAADVLTRDGRRGDVIQVEQQAVGLNSEIAALPSEWVPAVFDAIRYAVARGVVVVEPAGNGGFTRRGKGRGVSLDRPELQGRFDRVNHDSGAILVGGAEPVSRVATTTTNYGSRVDVQGYGLYVTTLGYGDLWGGKNNRQYAYTAVFEGTSSATPCVTGVAALVQASLRERGLPVLDSFLMRAVLSGTGAPDGSVRTRSLGPRPNALAASRGLADPAVPLITGVTFSKRKNSLTVDGIYFQGLNAPDQTRTVVYVNDQPTLTTYVDGFPGPDGTTTTRVVALDVGQLVPKGEITFVAVGDASGPLSPRRIFVRKKK